jgi:soluble lytic murein transglycosylase
MAYKIAFLYMDEGKYDEAISRWNQALAAKLGGEQRRNAQWYLAWCHYMSKDYNEALQDINAMLKAGKKSEIHDRLLYWKGRVLEKMGEKVAARDSYSQVISDHPDGYYAELAHRRIKGEKKDVGSFAMVEAKGRAESALQADVNFGDGGSGHFGRAVIFDRLSLHDEAARELRAAGLAGGGDELSRELILASRNFAHDAAYSTVAARYRDALKGSPSDGGLSRVIWESAYPRAYDPLVSRLVRDSSVDPRVIWSIMRNESTFRPEVVSPAGAVGLMQLMPATANRLARESGSGTVDRRALYRPAENIAWGVAYMKKLSNLFPNNPVAWIASYNAGEEAVARWIKNGRLDDIEEWIEEIPYDETNLYVKKVLVSYWNYQRLYGN